PGARGDRRIQLAIRVQPDRLRCVPHAAGLACLSLGLHAQVAWDRARDQWSRLEHHGIGPLSFAGGRSQLPLCRDLRRAVSAGVAHRLGYTAASTLNRYLKRARTRIRTWAARQAVTSSRSAEQ